MSNELFLVDGMLSGTGVRDAHRGGYVPPKSLGASEDTCQKIKKWLAEYEDHHYQGYLDEKKTEYLDKIGLEITKMLQGECAPLLFEYFSNAKMERIKSS